MSGEELRKIMEELNGEGEKSGSERYRFPEELSSKQLRGALNSYAGGVKPQEVVALLDLTVAGNGKKGFLFTENSVYGSSLKNGPVMFEEVRFAVRVDAAYDSYASALVCKDGAIHIVGGMDGIGFMKVLPLMQRLTGCGESEGRPVRRGEDFYKRYHAVIRREIRQIAEHYSAEGKGVHLAESRDPEILKNLIEGCQVQIEPEEILAVHNTTAKTGGFFTDRAYYSNHLGRLELNKVFYDGLERIAASPRDEREVLLLYGNGYIRGYRDIFKDEGRKNDLKMIEEIAGVFRIMETLPDTEENMSFAEGFKEFVCRREKGGLEAYKNSVFVSSTFKDMHYERDIIHEKVLPVLNQAGLEYGQTISFCDLRWGVNTGDLDNEEGSKKVLSVCLDEIERCRPYMIVILGERYGWIPKERMIANALEGRPGFALDELEKSVTALEIEFGALADEEQMDRTFFYFREIAGDPSDVYKSEDAYHAKKLSALKERIRKLAGKQMRSYRAFWDGEKKCLSGLTDFVQMVIRDIKGTMEAEWRLSAGQSVFQKELNMHWEQAEKKALQCSGRDGLIRSYLNELEQGEKMIVITGESGSGKSTLMGALCVTARLSGMDVLPVFCGYTAKSDTAIEIVQSVVYFLRQCLGGEQERGEEPASEEEWLERMNYLTERYTQKSGRYAVLAIDAVDQLLAEELRNGLKFLPSKLTDRVRVILSCTNEFPLPYVRNRHTLPLIGKEDKADVIRGILRLHRRELEDVVVNAIAAKPSSDNPLYMNLLIQQLLMMNKNDFDDIAGQGDGMSAISSHQLALIEKSADDLLGLCRETIHGAAKRIGGSFVEKAMEYLAVSRHGLRESDLEGILREEGILWNTLDFSLFINYLRSMFLIRDDGRVDFSHKSFREGIGGNLREKELHGKTWKWLKRLAENDEVRAQEILYHEIHGDKKAEFAADIRGHEGEDVFWQRAAKEVVLCSRADGGKWIAESLEVMEDPAVCQSYLRFLAGPVFRELENYAAGDTVETIYLAALGVAGRYAEAFRTAEGRRNVSVINRYLGQFYEGRKAGEDSDRARACFLKAIEIDEELEKENGSLKGKMDLAVDYSMLGEFYWRLGKQEEKEQAERYLKESIRLAEVVTEEEHSEENQKNLSASYLKIAGLYDTKEKRDTGIGYLEKCISLLESVVRKTPAVANKTKLCEAYFEMAFLCQMDNDPVYIERALYALEKDAALWEEIVEEDKRSRYIGKLGQVYAYRGLLYRRWNKELYAKEAIECCGRAIPLLEEAYRAGENVVRYLALACRDGAELLKKSSASSDVAQGKKWAERAVGLYEKIAKETGETKDYAELQGMLISCHSYVTGTKRALECSERSLQILEMLYKKTGDRQYKSLIKMAKFVRAQDKLLCKASV